MHDGHLKYDRHNLVWEYDGKEWVPHIENGEQAQYSNLEKVTTAGGGYRLMQFPAAEDPSGPDPRIMQYLNVIDNRLIVIEAKINELLSLIDTNFTT